MLIAKIVFSFLVLAYFFSKINLAEYKKILLDANLLFLLAALFFYYFNLIIFTFKWQVLVRMMKLNVGYWILFQNNLISLFYALFLPGGFLSGEAVKCYKISRASNLKTRLIFSVFVDRLTGAFAFIFIGIIFLLISRQFAYNIIIIYSILLLGVLLAYVFLVIKNLRRKIKGLVILLIKKIKPGLDLDKEKFIQAVDINKAILWGFLFQLALSLGLYFVVRSLGYEVGLFNLIWINSLVSVVTMLPISFLGIGLRDFSLVYFLGKFGLPPEVSLGAATLVVLLLVIRGLPGGAIEFKSFLFKK